MPQREQNGGIGIIKKLRRSASATEHNLSELRKRRSSSALLDQNGIPIDLNKYRKVLDKDDNGNGNVNGEKKQRYRRTQSVTRAEEIQSKEEKQRKEQPDKP